MKILIIVCLAVMEMVGAESGDSEGTKDHNKEAHQRLCTVLKAAVGTWGEGGAGLSDPLRNALGRTIFGKGSDWETVKKLQEQVPDDYKQVEEISGTRSAWCGERHSGGEDNGHNLRRWSGHSAPHDMVCLCTVGEKAWPVNRSATTTDNDKLCGADKKALGADDGVGWGYTKGEGNRHVEATWKVIVTPCLLGSGKKDELKKALEVFIENLNHTSVPEYRDIDRLGEGKFDTYRGCIGSARLGVCVLYYASFSPKPWWLQLKEAIKEDEQLQKQREEEEKRRQKEEAAQQEVPHEEALKSPPTTTNQTQQNNQHSNLTEKLRKLNLTSGTPISMPSSWLLSAVFLF